MNFTLCNLFCEILTITWLHCNCLVEKFNVFYLATQLRILNFTGDTIVNTPSISDQYTINPEFMAFVNQEVLPKVDISKEKFWQDLLSLIDDLNGENQELLETRSRMQRQIDDWHKAHTKEDSSTTEYIDFLRDIAYLEAEPENFEISPSNIDDEIANMSGPQLVVPLKNARFALNAADARWGSLYDALYGSDCIDGATKTGEYDTKRGEKVIDYAKTFLDESFPLNSGSHKEVTSYLVYFNNLLAIFGNGKTSGLKDSKQFFGYNGSKSEPESIFLKNNGLHIEIQFNKNGNTGQIDKANIDDIQLESALTTIMDCEDSVSAVDTEDKLSIYRNWLGLIEGNLKVTFSKGGNLVTRKLDTDKHLTGRDGDDAYLPGRSLMLIRNVGLHMKSNLIQNETYGDVAEGIIDAVITSLIASLDVNSKTSKRNSKRGSIYIVKPKLHGPTEVEFTCALFSRVEKMLNLNPNTIKIGIMDEERRTSVNLKACVKAARDRIFFINTGFLDRTGDEIHTSMHAGAFGLKNEIKSKTWFQAYEDNNVDVGLACGFQGRAQIGKGMWAMPDEMNRMLEEKKAHPQAGATTAWVPSPTAATLHALHYHQINVREIQNTLKETRVTKRIDMLKIPLSDGIDQVSDQDITSELENNVQGILGYVAPWIGNGTGCSKIPDINDVGLMEDRATLRISCQHISNWLMHGVCTKDEVESVLAKMARIVDRQNEDNPTYIPMLPNLMENLAFQAARKLIFTGVVEECGYTEPVLHRYRTLAKTQPLNEIENNQNYQLSIAN